MPNIPKFAQITFLVSILAFACPARPDKTPPTAIFPAQNTHAGIDSRHLRHFDAGDAYQTPQGRRSLNRLMDTLAVRLLPTSRTAAALPRAQAANAALPNYTISKTLRSDLHILRASVTAKPPLARQPTQSLEEEIHRARQTPGILSANPVFVDPTTGLWLVPNQEIIIRLQPGIEPKTYFGDDWPRTRSLPGTPDQFVLRLELTAAEHLLAEVDRRAADHRVVWAEPNFISQVRKLTDDPLYPFQWHLAHSGQNNSPVGADVRAEPAWNSTSGSSNVVIAFIDDGVQLDHPDLQDNIFSNPLETLNGLDDDQNGYIDDLHGWDFFHNDPDPSPEDVEDYHGTSTAGVAAALGNNQTGVTGIAFMAGIMPIKILSGVDGISFSEFAQAIYYAAGRTRNGNGTWRGADLISISLTFEHSQATADALSWAATNGRAGKGCPVFAATGNSATQWGTSRVRLPVGAMTGPGSYVFGFEYSKDIDTSNGDDLVMIDNVVLLAGDGFSHLDSTLGPEGRQDFEGSFPPPDWTMDSSQGDDWNVTPTRTLQGTGGSRSARSGTISHNAWTELQTPPIILVGNETLSFSVAASSEFGFDGLNVWVYDFFTAESVGVFGDPAGFPLVSGSLPPLPGIAFPASHPNVIAVGASTDFDLWADYSQYGPGLDLLAPSSGGWNEIVTTDRTGLDGLSAADHLFDFGGTSSACPLAAGVGALLLSINPDLTAAEVRSVLTKTCDKIGGVSYDATGWNEFYGHGRINALAAINQATLRITQIQKDGDNLRLSFTTLTSRHYRVERGDRFTIATVWTAVPGAENVPGTGGVVQGTDTDTSNADGSSTFYRVRQLP